MSSHSAPYPHLSYLSAGQKLGKYEIRHIIGRGGMAEVYRALNPDLNSDVAIKVLHPHVIESQAAVTRFRLEAQAVAALSHPNIVRVFDFHADDNLIFMVMELIEGPTLRQVLGNYPHGMPSDLAIQIFVPLANAVSYAHEQGIIHRDIKPANVLIANGIRPVLTDFGLAQIAGGTRITAAGTSFGTPAYMSPELTLGSVIRQESDIYSLGAVLYELVTGDVPFKGDSVTKVLADHLRSPVPPPSTIVEGLDPAIEAVILRALEKEPANRYHSAREIGLYPRGCGGDHWRDYRLTDSAPGAGSADTAARSARWDGIYPRRNLYDGHDQRR